MPTIEFISRRREGDALHVVGTVDGAGPYTVRVWVSHLATIPQLANKKRYVAERLNALHLATLPSGPDIDISGSIDIP